MFSDETAIENEMTIREVVDNIGKNALRVDEHGEIRVGVLTGVRVSVKNEMRGLQVETNGETVLWAENWQNTVFV